jgi:hypothetical protein
MNKPTRGRPKGEHQTERNIKLTDTHWEFLKALGGGYRPGIIKLITDQQEKTK